MTKYKYYIDGVVFKTKAEIDNFLKSEIIKKIKVLHNMMFSGRYNNAEIMRLYDDIAIRKKILHNEYGMSWEEIEKILFIA